jgi:hypothetical protein
LGIATKRDTMFIIGSTSLTAIQGGNGRLKTGIYGFKIFADCILHTQTV